MLVLVLIVKTIFPSPNTFQHRLEPETTVVNPPPATSHFNPLVDVILDSDDVVTMENAQDIPKVPMKYLFPEFQT